MTEHRKEYMRNYRREYRNTHPDYAGMTISMVLPIIPTAQMRARTAVRNGHAFAYKAGKQRHAEDSLISLMEKYRPAQPMNGASAHYLTITRP